MRIITRQMRLFQFRRYRRRVRNAVRILGTIFVIKLRLWKNSRMRLASDTVIAFLVALEEENRNTSGCLAFIVKSKKWRAYRIKIIILQRLWRKKILVIDAQVLLIDNQWKREQEKITNIDVDRMYKENEINVKEDNEVIEAMNRTRNLIKLRPLTKKDHISRAELEKQIIKGNDLLSIGNIVPTEYRHGIIKDVLQNMKQLHIFQLRRYEEEYYQYKRAVMSIQRRRAMLVKFSGNRVANALLLKSFKMCQEKATIKVSLPNIDIVIPNKPCFRVVLSPVSDILEKLSLVARFITDHTHP